MPAASSWSLTSGTVLSVLSCPLEVDQTPASSLYRGGNRERGGCLTLWDWWLGLRAVSRRILFCFPAADTNCYVMCPLAGGGDGLSVWWQEHVLISLEGAGEEGQALPTGSDSACPASSGLTHDLCCVWSLTRLSDPPSRSLVEGACAGCWACELKKKKKNCIYLWDITVVERT